MQHFARNDIHGPANSDRAIGTAFRKIERDFRARISEADDEHALRAESIAVRVFGTVQNGASEFVETGPRRPIRHTAESARDDEIPRAPGASIRDDLPAIVCATRA